MKKLFFLFTACSVLAVSSCQREGLPTHDEAPDAQFIKKGGGTLCECPGYELKNTGGEWSCPSGTGCSKIVPCPCAAIAITGSAVSGNLFLASKYQDFLDAQASGTLSDFFKTGHWIHVFPSLKDDPALRNDLIAGKYTVHTVTNSKGSTFLIVAPPVPSKGGVVTPAMAKLSVEIPAGII